MLNRDYYPNNRKVRWKFVIPFLVLLILIVYLGLNIRSEIKISKTNTYGVCTYNDRNTRKLFKNREFEGLMEIKDYLFYGETLNLYGEPYTLNDSDPVYGKTIILRDMCSQDDFVYMVSKTADGQIPLEDLQPGFYEVYIQADLKENRVFTNELIHEEFYTVSRKNKNHKITIEANASMFNNPKDTENYLDKNYLYINVEESNLPQEVYDVIIDPGHSSYDSGSVAEYGSKANGLVEAEETYKMSLVLKEELEKLGLKVLLTRQDANEVVNTYGENGRLYRGYQAKAKYYVEIQMTAANNEKLRGGQIVYSSFSSSRLASTVFKQVSSNPNFLSTGNSGKGDIPGISPSVIANGMDGRMTLRESGGRILGAGTYSDKSIEQNGPFASENRFGMQAITFEAIFITNYDDVQSWRKHYAEYGKQLAVGLGNYLQIMNR